MNLEGKRLLVLGGNPWLESIVSFVQGNGIKLIATGNNPNSKIFKYADEVYDIDSTNIDKMKAFIASHNIDGVYMGANEKVIAAACEYVNEMGLPCYCTKQTWNLLQNKAEFKKLCNKFDLPITRQYGIEELRNDDITYPLVVKPIDGCGSKGVTICHNYDEVLNGLTIAKTCTPSGKAIIEKFVNNNAFCALYTVLNGKATLSTIEAKYPVFYEKTKSYIGGVYLSDSICREEYQQLFDKKIDAMVQSLGIKTGSLWIEVFYDDNSYYFNEAGFRYGGEMSMFPVQYFSGVNQVASDIYYALTGESKIDGFQSLFKERQHKKYYCIYPLHVKPGKVQNIKGINKINNHSDVIAFFQKYECGDYIQDTGTFGQIFAFCHFVFDDWEECKKMINCIHSEIIIQSENGNLLNRMIDIDSIVFPF